MTSYFADVGDPGAIQIVNQAQAKYVKDYITGEVDWTGREAAGWIEPLLQQRSR